MNRIILLLLLAPLLNACASHGPGSIAGGECKIFEAPRYAIKGETQYDQDWVDSTIEGGVGGCHWTRPSPRPAELDAGEKKTKAAAPRTTAKPRRSFLRRFHDQFAPKKKPGDVPSPAPAAEMPPARQEPLAVEPTPAPPPAPRSRIEQLLRPNG
ncbi:hypothetical protein ACE10Z_23715 [Bradyrhizobium sp. Pha-3]|uniref:hypothetical protein n=1 Tax=Bradyrhizobium sp. Pha-3 TaxID=208375 RepID=UPI0035D46D6E